MVIETINKFVDFIPKIIVTLREYIEKLILALHLPVESSTTIFFLLVALFFSYTFIKQYVASSLFFKLSTLLNWLLMALLIFLILTRVS